MTSVRIIPPHERLDRVEFTEQFEWRDRSVQVGDYTCPRCGHRVGLKTADLRRHAFAPTRNLREPWLGLFEAARADRAQEWESHLDFHCPGCDAPVRLVYSQGSEWAMGVRSLHFTAILEAADWPLTG